MAFELTSRSLAQTAAFAAVVARVLQPGDILALDAPMGAGKTTFVRALAEALGVAPGLVSSPTFVLAHQYPTRDGWTLVHVDAYRLRSAEDLEAMGWDRLAIPAGVVVVEWAERVAAALPAERVSWMRIRAVGAGSQDSGVRRFEVEGELASRLVRAGTHGS